MMRHRTLAMFLAAAALSACDKNAVQDITSAPPGANIKFFNFGINAPGVNFYANDTKFTAISSTSGAESTTGTVYGGVGNGGFYSGIATGSYTFSGKIAAATDKDLAISKITGTIADGKSYSLYLSGFYDATAKSVDGFIVEDNYSAAIDYSQAYVRFVNAIPNSTPQTLYAKNTVTNTEIPIGGLVAYKGAGAFVPVPFGVYDLNTRTSGSSANAISRAAVSFVPGRVYSISSRGDMTVVSTTATNRPFLDNTTNR
ncbi:MAG: hypothetical protein JWM95_4539 [Gemmatimonadetes bacterium]|nr:hypothetical protein [Gemmatimonadota bacterium]